MRDECREIGRITGEKLIAGYRHHGDQRIDGVSRSAGGEQFTGRPRLAQPGAADLDHGQQPGQPSLPSAAAPRLGHHRCHRDERGASPAAEFDQPGRPPVITVDGDERTGVENEIQAAGSSLRPGAR